MKMVQRDEYSTAIGVISRILDGVNHMHGSGATFRFEIVETLLKESKTCETDGSRLDFRSNLLELLRRLLIQKIKAHLLAVYNIALEGQETRLIEITEGFDKASTSLYGQIMFSANELWQITDSGRKLAESFPKNFVNPETATLGELMMLGKNIIHIPSKLDVQRIQKLALLGKRILDPTRKILRILDIGGGHSFMGKLLADELIKISSKFSIINTDIDSDTLKQAKAAYGSTPGLHFVIANAERGGVNIFSETFDLILVSWPRKETMWGIQFQYTELIHKNKPPFVVWIGDESDLTTQFDVKDAYTPIAEWYGRHVLEVQRGITPHGYSASTKRGSSLVNVYARADIGPTLIQQAKNLLLQELENKEYRWILELRHMMPEDSDSITFDVTKFEK